MPDFKQQYKNPRLGFGDVSHNRNVRAYKQDKSRREIRTRAFDQNRELQDISQPVSPESTEDVSTINDKRLKKLIKWKEERNRKKKLEAAKKKPVFKVGIVHHSLCSPCTKNDASSTIAKSPKQVKRQNDIPKRITRATEKRLLAKASIKQMATFSKNTASTSGKCPINSNIQNPTSNKKKQKSFAPSNHEFRPPSGLQKMPLFGLVPVEQTPQEKGDFFIKDKPIECKTFDTNNIEIDQKDGLLQELNTRSPNTKKNTREFMISSSPKLLSNKRKSLQKLNGLISDSLNTTFELKETMEESNKRLSIEKDPSQEEKSLSDSDDTKTPQKTVSIELADINKGNIDTENLIAFSPYLTLSRGKKNARKEQQQRLGIGRSPPDEIPTKDTVMKNLNISVEEEERTAQYFKFLVNKETERLQDLCKKWLDVQSEQDVPDDAMYEINQAVGQTNLLISKKFERFRRLVQDCETGKGEMLVTCRDLQGFWDMTYMEVENCDMRFEKLEQRRNRQWREEECTVNKLVAKKKRMPAKKQIAASKPSSLRSLILAARKRKMETGTDLPNKEDLLPQDLSKKCIASLPSNRKSMTFKENYSVRRNTRSRSIGFNERKSISAQNENSKINLIQKMHLSSASKKLRSPFAAMKISQMCKTPEVQLDETITYVNSDQTPGKSILKKSEELITKEARIKSAHKVNFDDKIILTEVSLDKEAQTKLKLAAALSRIDNLDLEELSVEESINAEKRLNFEDSDSSINFDEFTTEVQMQLEMHKSPIQNTLDFNEHSSNIITSSLIEKTSPNNGEIITSKKNLRLRTRYLKTSDDEKCINVISVTPLKTNVETPIISETISNAEIKQDDELEIKILRNRTITTNDTVKMNRTSKMITPKRESTSKKENKSPTKTNRKSSLKLQKIDEKYTMSIKDTTIEIENTMLDVDKRRKSSRKSVAFNAEACLVCAENKPVLPMTPHSKRRSKTPSKLSRSKRTLDEDLISWNTPELPARITRSHVKIN